MKHPLNFLLAAGLMAASASSQVSWLEDFDSAKARAAFSGRPVLWFQLLGDLDTEFC